MIYGTGVDIVDISRFQRFVSENNTSLLQRVFTPRELEYCSGKKHSAQHFALRFAAKEAFLKALGTGLRGGVSWQHMEIVNDRLGKPEMLLTGKAGELFAEAGLQKIFLSLSHDGNMAVAMLVLEK
ncbi:acyl carrier protein 4'-phosphopantetheinyltransferase [Geotalea daltonii FRC-32]|uniref:Holo-[acyl-carrier-protein] synthase n=1 Tax=Geotalea daltonii (strain DSM 22248 / JCM 15807 / FRC-32) TaxID=316067 RepID=ACPS_GEODF|nr:holo-[acyl-carrier-protein] synthase [Geotalea daltonii]B9M2U0.1 RecName: Full=Holo-[acyl-carrier-protein] synthase; Short=Holo-ACP synthase; AltName: Full=4'-phosphopantetheinyl transferase AcpS [Geotalea daltonii FRC-32]ACM21286.1 acyl carrier protein 4'-phosphopantetheinyltransferase [Geotalea daltonii FRC-32]